MDSRGSKHRAFNGMRPSRELKEVLAVWHVCSAQLPVRTPDDIEAVETMSPGDKSVAPLDRNPILASLGDLIRLTGDPNELTYGAAEL